MSVNSVSSMNVMPQKVQAKKKAPIAKGAIIGASVGASVAYGLIPLGMGYVASQLGQGFWKVVGTTYKLHFKGLGTLRGLGGLAKIVGIPTLVGAGIGAIVKACKKKPPVVENK